MRWSSSPCPPPYAPSAARLVESSGPASPAAGSPAIGNVRASSKVPWASTTGLNAPLVVQQVRTECGPVRSAKAKAGSLFGIDHSEAVGAACDGPVVNSPNDKAPPERGFVISKRDFRSGSSHRCRGTDRCCRTERCQRLSRTVGPRLWISCRDDGCALVSCSAPVRGAETPAPQDIGARHPVEPPRCCRVAR